MLVVLHSQSNWKRKAIIGGYLLQVKSLKNQRIGQQFKHLSFVYDENICSKHSVYTNEYILIILTRRIQRYMNTNKHTVSLLLGRFKLFFL